MIKQWKKVKSKLHEQIDIKSKATKQKNDLKQKDHGHCCVVKLILKLAYCLINIEELDFGKTVKLKTAS